ncbi:MAG: phosphotransferase [Eubacterium sp.]|nr:phosphotransferase [Eubacterium sp.]
MKYVNATEVLPEELLSMIQKYYEGGYLYIPKENHCKAIQQTDYKLELEKRNQYIYLKHLEGRTNVQIGQIYHLSESSIRRIILKEKGRYQKMKEIIKQILPLWEMEGGQFLQIYPSAWEINHDYVIKVYDDKKQLERNIKISEILSGCKIPVAKIVPTKTGETYTAYQDSYFLMSKKLQGSPVCDLKNKTVAWKMGCAIAKLHRAFVQCEKEVAFWDNSLLKEMKGWVRENLAKKEWKLLGEAKYEHTVKRLENVYPSLPKQLIHRDVHFGNFLFFEGNLSGYIDFDLSQRNIRIFDICYFLTGLLTEETEDAFTKKEWLENVQAVMEGYESIIQLSETEKQAIPCVMECIEILFTAYYFGVSDTKRANDAYDAFCLIQNCESDIENRI